MTIYLHGPDTYRSSMVLREMKEKFTRERDPQGMNLVELVVGDVSDGTVIEQLHATPFLAEKRMIVLKHLIARGSKELHALLQDHIGQDSLPEDTIVLVWDGAVSPKTKVGKELFALLKAQPYSNEFEAVTGRALEEWATKTVAVRGGGIDRSAALQLTAAQGNDMWQLSQTIDQLIAFAGTRTITVQDVQTFVRPVVDDDIFALVDSAVQGNLSRAYDMIRAQYRSGNDAHYIFSMLLRQYRIMLDIADAIERGETPDAKALGLHPFVLKKTLPLVQRMSFSAIVQRYLQLLAIDKRIKTGSADPELLVDIFIGNSPH